MARPDLLNFVTARIARAWSDARDRELASGLDESFDTHCLDILRKITDRHAECGSGYGYCDDGGHGIDGIGCVTLLDIAAIWDDHPDYWPAWKS